MRLHYLIPDNYYIKNLSRKKVDEIINLNEPIPNLIKSFLKDNIPYFEYKRDDVLTEEIINKEKIEEIHALNMPSFVAFEYHNLLVFEFIDMHPEYKPFIKEVIDVKDLKKEVSLE
ncbi:hypothetical protein [Methanobrevibacter sp. DSM 116169]|uniref:hypothetical protein n=1 Tax=Methanobrevibacter sp. DSM 116169 TaxID=3242727 RepID=UPI0038FCDEB1